MRLYLFLHPVNRIIDMTSKLKLFTLAAVVSLCSGCEDRYSGPDLKGSDLSFSVQVLDYDGTLAEHRWTEGDRIGISVAGMSDYYDPDTNVAFDYNPETGLFEPVNDNIIIKGKDRVLLAYYPWTGAENQVPAEVSVNIENGVPDADYLFASDTVSRDQPDAVFEFSHVLSKLHIDFVDATGSGAAASEADYVLSGLVQTGRLDPHSGDILVNDTVEPEDVVLQTVNMSTDIILVPQTCTVTMSLVFAGKTYITDFEISLEQGKVHNYKVTINNDILDAELAVEDNGSADWETGPVTDITSGNGGNN